MKIKFSLALLCIAGLLLAGCQKAEEPSVSEDDLTKFSTTSIVGTWVVVGHTLSAVTQETEVDYYYDITSDAHLYYVDQLGNTTGRATYNPADECIHTTSDFQWSQSGDMTYTFDEAKQVIRCHTGTCWGFSVDWLVRRLGSDEIFDVQRLGMNEGMIYDKTGYLRDAHVFRVKGVKKDLQ